MTRPTTWPTLALVLALLAATASAQAPAREPQRPRVLLPGGSVPKVRVAPGLPTLFLFEAAIDKDALELEERNKRARLVDAGEFMLLVEPLVKLAPDESLLMTVPFKGELAPARASFALVSSPSGVDERVVVRPPPSAAAPQSPQEEQPGRCSWNGSPPAAPGARAGEGEPAGLILSGRIDEAGVIARHSSLGRPSGVQQGMRVRDEAGAVGFRASQWVALALTVQNLPGQEPWRLGGARLTSARTGRPLETLSVCMEEPRLGAGESGRVVVEARAPSEAEGDVFALELWDASGGRHLSLPGLRLPAPGAGLPGAPR